MPCYHFTMKIDRRPDGVAINPKDHADYISRNGKYQDVDEIKKDASSSSKSVAAQVHAEYINREAAFRSKGGCIYKAHQLPSWAQDSPTKFFEIADQYEDPKNIRYREIEFALPNELTLEQNKEIIDEFIYNHLKDFYYAYAIHDKDAAMSNDERNTHVHIMFSERRIDDIERAQERPEGIFFKKANWRDLSRGGAKKDGKWNGAQRAKYLFEMRRDFAMIQNKVLEKHGYDVRVDHRSLKIQREDALRRGDTVLAKILDRIPERHLGPEVSANRNHPDVIELKRYRIAKYEHQKLIYAADLLEQALKRDVLLQSLDDVRIRSANAITESEKMISEINLSEQSEVFHACKNDIFELSKEIVAVQNSMVSYKDVFDMVRKNFMSPEEKRISLKLSLIHQDIFAAKQLFKQLEKSPSVHAQTSFTEIEKLKKEILNRIEDCTKEKNTLAREFANVNKRLSTPKMKGKISKEVNQNLHDNQPAQERLEELNKALFRRTESIQKMILNQIQNNADFSDRDTWNISAVKIAKILDLTKHSIYIEEKSIQKDLEKLVPKYISEARAMEMAKNVFSKGRCKALRESDQIIKKERSHINAIKDARSKAQYEFSKLPSPKWWQDSSEYKKAKQEVERLDQLLNEKSRNLQNKLAAYGKESSDLQSLCGSIEAQRKIISIAKGILAKNKPIAENIITLKQRLGKLQNKSKELLKTKKSVDRQVILDKDKNISYQVRRSISGGGSSSSPSTNPIRLIADAISRDPVAIPLVARLEENKEIDWSGLNELDRKVAIAEIERN